MARRVDIERDDPAAGVVILVVARAARNGGYIRVASALRLEFPLNRSATRPRAPARAGTGGRGIIVLCRRRARRWAAERRAHVQFRPLGEWRSGAMVTLGDPDSGVIGSRRDRLDRCRAIESPTEAASRGAGARPSGGVTTGHIQVTDLDSVPRGARRRIVCNTGRLE